MDRATELYEMEKQARRRKEREKLKLEGNHESLVHFSERRVRDGRFKDGKNTAAIDLLNTDGFALLTEEGREGKVGSILIPCFNEAQVFNHTTLDSVKANSEFK